MIKLFKSSKKPRKPPQQWPEHVESLNKETFNEFINTYPLTLVDFWAPWCKPCKTMLPRLRRLERLYQGKVAFGRLNTQQEQTIAKKYNVMSIPHFAFFRYGKKIGDAFGAKSVGDMKDIIEDYISKQG